MNFDKEGQLTILEEIDARERGYRKQIAFLRQENKELRDKLWQEQLRSIEHGNAMFHHLITATLDAALKKEGQ
jgi:hypothetical protein